MSEGLKLLRAVVEQGATVTLRNLTVDLFVGAEEEAAFNFVRRHYRMYSELPDANTVAEDTGTTLPRAREVAQFYYDRCYDRRMFNAVREPFNELRTALMNNDADLSRELISSMSTSVRVYDAEQDVLTMSELSRDVLNHYEHNHIATALSGIPTGWPTIDDQTDGWQPGDLGLLVVRPGVGKTHLLIHSARMAWMSGRKVLFVSMEMTLRQIAYRFYAHHAGVDPDLFRKGRLSNLAMRRVRGAMEEMEGDNRFHLFAGNFKGKRTEEVDALVQELGPDIIYIDGMYIMNPVNAPKYVDRNSKVAYVADEVKQMALQRDRPVIGTIQFNRDAGKGGKAGTLENLAQSDALSQHGSVILGAKMPPNDKSDRPAHRVISTLKGREGEHGDIAINFKFTPINFGECTQEEQLEILTKDSERHGVQDMDYMT